MSPGSNAILLTDDSTASEEAKGLLAQAGICFDELHNPPESRTMYLPHLISAMGEFPGLDLIKWYASVYGTTQHA